jgi:hypothetical protein
MPTPSKAWGGRVVDLTEVPSAQRQIIRRVFAALREMDPDPRTMVRALLSVTEYVEANLAAFEPSYTTDYVALLRDVATSVEQRARATRRPGRSRPDPAPRRVIKR